MSLKKKRIYELDPVIAAALAHLFEVDEFVEATQKYASRRVSLQQIKDLLDTFYGTADPGYLVYTALISAPTGGSPVVTVLENTIGNIVWTHEEIGIYFGTLAGAFTDGKTILPIQVGMVPSTNPYNEPPFMYEVHRANADFCVLAIKPYGLQGEGPDAIEVPVAVEIRVYP